MVVTSEPATIETGVTQERTAWPLTSTVHDPHCPRPQPNFGPRSSKSSLSTYSSGVVGSTLTECARPFTVKFNTLMNSSLPGKQQFDQNIEPQRARKQEYARALGTQARGRRCLA